MLEEDVVESAVGDAIYSLFHDQLYLPLRPLKLFCQTLLRHELCPDRIIAEPSSYLRLPEKQVELSIKVVKLGKTDFYAGKHLIPYVSSKSLAVCYQLYRQVMDSLGNPVTELKTESVIAYFVDVISACDALSSSLSRPRPHRMSVTCEIIIQTKTFDEALNIFMRRVLEETHAAGNSDRIVSAALCVTTENNNQHYLDIKQMKDKRQQVLTLLKAAICAEGKLVLQFFMQCRERTLPVYHSDYRSYRIPSSGYLQVTRTYQLTYTDTQGRSRCFTPVPLRSLACGVFFELSGAQQLLSAYIQQTQRNSVVKTANREASALNMLVVELSQEVSACWWDGEVMNGLEKMILLNAILEGGDGDNNTRSKASKVKPPSHLYSQLKFGMNTIAGHIRAIRDASESTLGVIRLLIDFTLHNPSLRSYQSRHAISEDERNELDRFFQQLVMLPACLEEIKQLLRELSMVNTCTTLLFLQPSLLSSIQALYNPVNPAKCLIPSEVKAWKRMDLAKMLSHLRSMMRQLQRLDETLWTIESTIAMDYISALLRVDLQSYAEYQVLGLKEQQQQTTGNKTTAIVDPFPLLGLRDNQEAPRNFRDLLGFAICRSRDQNQSWRTASVHDSLVFEHFGNVPATYEEDSYAGEENDFMSLASIWDMYGYLGGYNRRRYGAVDRRQLAKVEILRQAVPNAILLQASKIRYLAHTQLLRALHAGSLGMQTVSRTVPRSVAMLKGLLPTALLASEPSIDLFSLADKLLQPVREDHLHLLDNQHMLEGPYRLDLLQGFSGGILGSDRWLSVLGDHSDELLGLAWSIPPLLPRPPSSNVVNSSRGITWHVNCGMQTETAISYLASRQNIGEIAMDELSLHEARAEHEAQLLQRQKEGQQQAKPATLKARMPGLSARVAPTLAKEEIIDKEEEAVYHSHTGIARPPLGGPLKLELVYIAEHDKNQVDEDKIRSSFGRLVLELVDSMTGEQHSSNSVWRLLCATIDSTAKNNNSLAQHFEARELANDNNNDGNGLREVFSNECGKNGEVVLSAMALLSHGQDALLSADELYRLLHQHGAGIDINKSYDEFEGNRKGSLSSRKGIRGRGLTKMAAHLFNPPVMSSKHGKGTENGSNQPDDWSEMSFGEDQYLLPQEEAEEERTDPTFNDSARLYSENDFNRIVQRYLYQKAAGRSRVYVPVELHITLVGQQKSVFQGHQRDHRQQGHSLLTKSTSLISSLAVSRLIASTLFFSSQAAKQTWQLITRIRGPALSLALHATHLQTLVKQLMQVWYRQWHARYAIAVLTQRLPHTLHLHRLFFSYPALLIQLSSVLHACGLLLTSQANAILSVSLSSLRLTLTGAQLFMREMLSSTAAVMMRGGVAGAAALVQRAVRLLGLFSSIAGQAGVMPPAVAVATDKNKKNDNKKKGINNEAKTLQLPRNNHPATISMQEDFHEDGLVPPPPANPATGTEPVIASRGGGGQSQKKKTVGNMYRRIGGEIRLQEDDDDNDNDPRFNSDNNDNNIDEGDDLFSSYDRPAQTEEQADDSLRRILHAQPKRTKLAGELLLRAAFALETIADCQGQALTEALHGDTTADEGEREDASAAIDSLPVFRPLTDGLPLILGVNLNLNDANNNTMLDPHTILSIAHRAQSATHLQLLDRPYMKHALSMLTSSDNNDAEGVEGSKREAAGRAIGYKFLDHHHEHTDVTTMLQQQDSSRQQDATAKMKAMAMAAVFDLSLQHRQQQAAFISSSLPANKNDTTSTATAAKAKSVTLSGSSSKVSLNLSNSNSRASLKLLPAAQHKHMKQVALLQQALRQLSSAANAEVAIPQNDSSNGNSNGLFMADSNRSSRDSLFSRDNNNIGNKPGTGIGIRLKSSSGEDLSPSLSSSQQLRPSTTQRSSSLPFPFLSDSRSTDLMSSAAGNTNNSSSMIQLLLSDPTPKPFLTVFPDPAPRDDDDGVGGREEYRIRPRVDYAQAMRQGGAVEGGSMLSMLRSAYGIAATASNTHRDNSNEEEEDDVDNNSGSALRRMRSMAVQRQSQQRQKDVMGMEIDHARFVASSLQQQQQPLQQSNEEEEVTLASNT